MFDTRLRTLVVVTTLFGLGHHLDHILRGNHVGWPLTDRFTPFTYSLVVYPLILLGWILSRQGRVGVGYWAILAAAGAAFVGLLHFGPFALEPPPDIVNFHSSRAAGWFALAWLVAFVAVLVGTAIHATRVWLRERAQVAGR